MGVCTSASAWDAFNLCWLFIGNKTIVTQSLHTWWSKTKYSDFDKQALMIQGWSGKKLFCDLLKILRLTAISILFGWILDGLWCCLGDSCGSVCVWASGESDVAVRGGSIMSLQSLALHWWQQLCIPLLSSNSLVRVTPALPLPRTSEGSAVLGCHTACQLIPETVQWK